MNYCVLKKSIECLHNHKYFHSILHFSGSQFYSVFDACCWDASLYGQDSFNRWRWGMPRTEIQGKVSKVSNVLGVALIMLFLRVHFHYCALGQLLPPQESGLDRILHYNTEVRKVFCGLWKIFQNALLTSFVLGLLHDRLKWDRRYFSLTFLVYCLDIALWDGQS